VVVGVAVQQQLQPHTVEMAVLAVEVVTLIVLIV
jgi:hypothetical protein